jgi:hypothetical protein
VKNVFLAMVVTLGLLACGADGKIDVKPDTSGSGGAGGSIGAAGNGGNGAGDCGCNGDGTRLTRQYVIGDDGSKMESFAWHDNVLDLKCAFQSLPNGETRCVPPHIAMNAYFDAGCTQPAFVFVAPKLECVDMPLYARFDKCTFDTCNSITDSEIYHVDLADDRSSNLYWYNLLPDGTCDSVSGSGKTYNLYGVYKIGNQDKFVKAVSGVGF